MLERSFTVDVLKVVAAQFIVWHHFSAYGPMADTMTLMWPQLMEWLYSYARLAVQVFLVVGGFLAAQSLMGRHVTAPSRLIAKRFMRLVPIYMLALLLICVVVALSRSTIQASWLPSEPSVWQLVAHGLLLHDLLDIEALSSGVWYVAIDFQLYAMLVILHFLVHTPNSRRIATAVAVLCVASMWYFNRVDELDMWGIYFFSAYGLGVLAAWAKHSSFEAKLFWLTTLLAVLALCVEFRTRLSLALITAVWLVIKPTSMVHWTLFKHVVQRLSNSSYVLFVTHFGVIVLTSALWVKFGLDGTDAAMAPTALILTAAAWLLSAILAWGLHERLEVPLHHWLVKKTKRFFS